MTDPITPATIARLRELIKAAGEWPDLEPEDQSDGSFRCPLCDGQGEIEAEHVKDGRREYGNDSWFSLVGVQVYGVGDAMASMEALLPLLIKHTPALLDQIAAQAAEIKRQKSEIGRLFAMVEPLEKEAAHAWDRAAAAEARVAELEGLLRKHAALACGACMGTGAYLGDEDRDGPCDVCGGTGHVLPEDVAAVLAGRDGGR